eukprot:CAMPEP_0184321130 /NCGR_PEP_ID=MMETSP1049-20130417/117456_1 /TAXON_ID=77928 /ORGANISM="Proteomonas sulcata, Strain CCMP704" /LENGTH=305 /DNA_ID=CAMNT_0026641833 /DNA_START=19 /DNA_END=936 /DNA_ORIENTATION=-
MDLEEEKKLKSMRRNQRPSDFSTDGCDSFEGFVDEIQDSREMEAGEECIHRVEEIHPAVHWKRGQDGEEEDQEELVFIGKYPLMGKSKAFKILCSTLPALRCVKSWLASGKVDGIIRRGETSMRFKILENLSYNTRGEPTQRPSSAPTTSSKFGIPRKEWDQLLKEAKEPFFSAFFSGKQSGVTSKQLRNNFREWERNCQANPEAAPHDLLQRAASAQPAKKKCPFESPKMNRTAYLRGVREIGTSEGCRAQKLKSEDKCKGFVTVGKVVFNLGQGKDADKVVQQELRNVQKRLITLVKNTHRSK